jgi:hypothetical protein
MRRALISQSNYIPWKGYFDAIRLCDVFVLYDDMQFTKRDWRNRNLIKTQAGTQWLSIPVEVAGKFHQKINETRVSDPKWNLVHWRTIAGSYARAPYFKEFKPVVEELYLDCRETLLSEINFRFLSAICDFLEIKTKLVRSSEFTLSGENSSERLMNLCLDLGAQEYLTGPAARDYLNVEIFERNKVAVKWMDYSRYPVYPQLFGEFVHGVSVLDVIFNLGPHARSAIFAAKI